MDWSWLTPLAVGALLTFGIEEWRAYQDRRNRKAERKKAMMDSRTEDVRQALVRVNTLAASAEAGLFGPSQTKMDDEELALRNKYWALDMVKELQGILACRAFVAPELFVPDQQALSKIHQVYGIVARMSADAWEVFHGDRDAGSVQGHYEELRVLTGEISERLDAVRDET